MIIYNEETNEINVEYGDELIVVNRRPMYGDIYYELGEKWNVFGKRDGRLLIIKEGESMDERGVVSSPHSAGWVLFNNIVKTFDKIE